MPKYLDNKNFSVIFASEMVKEVTGTHREQFHKVSLKREKLSSYLYDVSKIILSATSVAAITAIINNEVRVVHVYVGVMGLLLTIFLRG